ncbi:MAG: hypothetical protein K2N80_08765 [Lachnospiraceae bacterium]|nr:hypothetical protein [Lachnospiraceae bacterium]
MDVTQLIYTACKTGITRSGNGFQIFSYSEKIPAAYYSLAGIGKMCKYKSPNHLPTSPTKEEVKNLFPVNYIYNKIDDKHRYIARNKYVGLDNTGKRYGNFISHCFAFDEYAGYPVSALGSSIFIDDLSEADKNLDCAPKFLSSVKEEELFDGSMSFDAVSHYFTEDSSRFFYLKAMVKAIFECFKSGKRIVICDDMENIPYWIAGVTYAFPENIAREITFSTYAYDPLEADCFICGVLPEGTVYSPKSTCDMGIFYVFDFIHNVFNFDDNEGGYVDVVEAGYTVNRVILDTFFTFVNELSYSVKDGYLPALYDAYQAYNGKAGSMDFSTLRVAFEYVLDCSNKIFCDKFFSTILKHLDDSENSNCDNVFICIKYAFQASQKTNNTQMRKYVCYVYWMKILFMVNEYELIGKDNIENLQDNIFSINADVQMEIKRALVSAEVANEVEISLKEDTVEYHNVFWGRQILSFIAEQNLPLEVYANRYNSDILRAIYYNIQLVTDPVGCIEKITNKIPLNLKYYFYVSLFPLFQDKKGIKDELQEKTFEFLKDDRETLLLYEYMISLKDFSEYDLKTRIIKYIIIAEPNNMDGFYHLCNELRHDENYWNSVQAQLVEYFYHNVIAGRNNANDFFTLVIFTLKNVNHIECVEKICRAYDKTIKLNESSQNDIKRLNDYLQQLESRKIEYFDTKAYAVWFLHHKVFGKELRTIESISVVKQCSFCGFTEKEIEFTVKKVYKQCGALLNNMNAQKIFCEAFINSGDSFWMYYCKEVLESIERKPAMFASLFEYVVTFNIQLAYELFWAYFVSVPRRQLQKINEHVECCIDKKVKKEYTLFMERIESEQDRNKTGILGKFKNVFGRKGNS